MVHGGGSSTRSRAQILVRYAMTSVLGISWIKKLANAVDFMMLNLHCFVWASNPPPFLLAKNRERSHHGWPKEVQWRCRAYKFVWWFYGLCPFSFTLHLSFGSAVDIVTVDGHEARGLVASGNRYLDVRWAMYSFCSWDVVDEETAEYADWLATGEGWRRTSRKNM